MTRDDIATLREAIPSLPDKVEGGCHYGLCDQDRCGNCSRIMAANKVVDRLQQAIDRQADGETSYERSEFDRTKLAFEHAIEDFSRALDKRRDSAITQAETLFGYTWSDFKEAASGPLEYYELGCDIENERNVLREGLEAIAGDALRDKTSAELRAIAAKVLEDSTK